MKLLSWFLLLSLTAPAAAELADPTAPTDPARYFGQGTERAAGWELNSVLVGPGRRVAMINGVPVQEGGQVGGARVLRIDAAGVVLQAGDRRIQLRLLTSHTRRLETPPHAAQPRVTLRTLNETPQTTAQP